MASAALLVPLLLAAADLDLSRQFPDGACWQWAGTMAGNDPHVATDLWLCRSGQRVSGSLLWRGSHSGHSLRQVAGRFEDSQLVLADERIAHDAPQAGWRFCLIERYSLRQTNADRFLAGEYHSSACGDRARIELGFLGQAPTLPVQALELRRLPAAPPGAPAYFDPALAEASGAPPLGVLVALTISPEQGERLESLVPRFSLRPTRVALQSTLLAPAAPGPPATGRPQAGDRRTAALADAAAMTAKPALSLDPQAAEQVARRTRSPLVMRDVPLQVVGAGVYQGSYAVSLTPDVQVWLDFIEYRWRNGKRGVLYVNRRPEEPTP